MTERPFSPPPYFERRYGDLRCRRYLFDAPCAPSEGTPTQGPASQRAAPGAAEPGRADAAERPR